MEKYIYTILLLPLLLLSSCSEDDLNPNSVIVDTAETPNEFDNWLLTNYTYPYNIEVKYKLEDVDIKSSDILSPALPEKSKIMCQILQHIWLETFNEIKGIDFSREHSPKVLVLIGSYEYTSSGTIVEGTAESGMKITLYGVNDLNPDNLSKEKLLIYMKTIIHEFCHILHQKKAFNPEFDIISRSDYLGDDWDRVSEEKAYSLGFISRYALQNVNEDFVETIAWYVVYGEEYWNSISSKAGASGAEKLNKKFSIVQGYLNDTWGIDIHKLRLVFNNRLNSVDMLDFK